jgi:hypothetical protein
MDSRKVGLTSFGMSGALGKMRGFLAPLRMTNKDRSDEVMGQKPQASEILEKRILVGFEDGGGAGGGLEDQAGIVREGDLAAPGDPAAIDGDGGAIGSDAG